MQNTKVSPPFLFSHSFPLGHISVSMARNASPSTIVSMWKRKGSPGDPKITEAFVSFRCGEECWVALLLPGLLGTRNSKGFWTLHSGDSGKLDRRMGPWQWRAESWTLPPSPSVRRYWTRAVWKLWI